MSTYQLPIQFSPSESLESYIKWANQQDNLSITEEAALLATFHDTNAAAADKIEAARALIISHLKYVCFIARSYSKYGLPLADLIQEGNIGLMKALKKFDPSHKVRLVTYATHWIKAEIQEFIVKNIHMVKRITTKVKKKIWQMLPSSNRTHQEAQDIADELNIDVNQVYDMSSALTTDTYLEEQLPEGQVRRIDMLADHTHMSPEHLITDESSSQLARIEASLQSLDDREKHIIQQRWLSEKKTPFRTIADTLGVSIERVRQIESAAIAKIKASV